MVCHCGTKGRIKTHAHITMHACVIALQINTHIHCRHYLPITHGLVSFQDESLLRSLEDGLRALLAIEVC